MRVVRKQQNLRLLGQLAQYSQSGNGSVVVEGHQHIIEDHWARSDSDAIVLNVRKSQGKEQLIASTVTHSRDVNMLS